MRPVIVWGVCLTLAGVACGMDRYQIILEREPFGRTPTADPGLEKQPPEELFEGVLRLSALYQTEGGRVRAGLVNLETNDSFFLRVGETYEGIELIAANFDDREVVLQHGDVLGVVVLDASGPEEQRYQAQLGQPSPEERRRQMREARRNRPPQQPPARDARGRAPRPAAETNRSER